MTKQLSFKTKSEALFAGYLDSRCYAWEYEPQIAAQAKRPDFRARRRDVLCLIDVKERSAKPPPDKAHNFDPIEGARKLIENGREKFKHFDDYLCVLVVYNNGDCDTRLNVHSMFGAMLGNPGFSVNFDAQRGRVDIDTLQNGFLERGGKLIRHYNPLEPHESPKNMSAIVIMRELGLRAERVQARYQIVAGEMENKLRRSLTENERFELRLAIGADLGDDPQTVTQLMVCENPFARQRLPENIFDGPYDERWSVKSGVLDRVVAGSEIRSSEPDPHEW
jgi:hypothetical protein